MMSRKAASRFREFIESRDETSNLLPLVHTTTAYSFDEICTGDHIEPENCHHFNEKLIYLFYGRPAYRVEDSTKSSLEFNWPIIFIFHPEKITDIKEIYPFDTGAFFFKLYEKFFSRKTQVTDFSLPGSIEYAMKLVGIYYDTSDNYYRGMSHKNVDLPNRSFEAQAVQELARLPPFTTSESPDARRRDERSTSIEVQSATPIDITDAAIGIVLPQPYLQDPYVVKALDRWNIPNQSYYEIFGFHDSEAWLSEIYSEVKKIYIKCGYLRDV